MFNRPSMRRPVVAIALGSIAACMAACGGGDGAADRSVTPAASNAISPSSPPPGDARTRVVAQAASYLTEETLFGNAAAPQAGDVTDQTSYELGVKMTATSAGQIRAIRYWKAPSETPVPCGGCGYAHTGRLWTAGGSLLGSVHFTNETASGWQEARFTTPIDVAANQTVVVTVDTNRYFVDTYDVLASPISSAHLVSVADGNDGVFGPLGGFPTQSYRNSNYYRDVVFAAQDSSTPPPPTVGITTAQVGSGTTDPSNQQIVRTQSDNVYLVIPDGATYPSNPSARLRVFVGNAIGRPTGFVELDSAHAPDGGVNTSSIAIDGNDVIHALWLDGRGQTHYGTFDTTTQRWTSNIVLDNNGWTTFSQGDEGAALQIDANGAPHAAWTFKDASGALHIRYANNLSGTWSAPVAVDSGTVKNAWHPTLAFAPNGDLSLAWLDGTGNYSLDGLVRTRVRSASGAWQATVTINDTAVAGLDNGPSMVIGADGTRHITFCDSKNDIRYWYDRGAGWTGDRQPPTQVTHDPVLGPDGNGGWYLYGHGTPDNNFNGVGQNKYRFHLIANATAWGPWTEVVASADIDDATNARWAQFFYRHPEHVDFSYWTHTPGNGATGYVVFLATDSDSTDTVPPPPPPPPSGQLLVGDQTIESNVDDNPPGIAEAFQFVASGSGNAGTLGVYVDASNQATSIIVGIYSDAAGQPGTLLSSGTITNPTAAAWNTAVLPGAVALTSGTRYWLAILGPATTATVQFRDTAAGTAPAVASAQTSLTALPATWSTNGRWMNAPASIYVLSQ